MALDEMLKLKLTYAPPRIHRDVAVMRRRPSLSLRVRLSVYVYASPPLPSSVTPTQLFPYDLGLV